MASCLRLQPCRELNLQLTLQLQTQLPALNIFLNSTSTVKWSFTVTVARPFNELQLFGIVLKIQSQELLLSLL